MPLVFSQSPHRSESPVTIRKSPSVRELVAQVEATSRVPFWRDPKQVQPHRSLYHTLSRILVSDLSSEEFFSDSYTSESLTNSDQVSFAQTLNPESGPSSPILRSTPVHGLETSSRLLSGQARLSRSFEAEIHYSRDSPKSQSSLGIAADAITDTPSSELPTIAPGSPLIIQFFDSFPEYSIETQTDEGVANSTTSQLQSSAQSVPSYYFLQNHSVELLEENSLDASLSRCQSFPQPDTPDQALEPEDQTIGDIVLLDLDQYHSPVQVAVQLTPDPSKEGSFEHQVDNQGGDGTAESLPSTSLVNTNDTHSKALSESDSGASHPSDRLNLQTSSFQESHNHQEEDQLKLDHPSGTKISQSSVSSSSGKENLSRHSSRKSLRVPSLSTVAESPLTSGNHASIHDSKQSSHLSPNSFRQRQSKSIAAIRSYYLPGRSISNKLRVIPPKPASLYLPQYLVDDLKSFDPVDILQLEPDSPIGGVQAPPMSSSAPTRAVANEQGQSTSVGTRAIKLSEAEPRESCCEDEESKGKEKPKGSENQSPDTDSSLGRINMASVTLESAKPSKDKSDKAEEKAKKKIERVKKTVGKVLHKSRSLALQKPVLVIVLGRPLAGPVHDNLVTIADGEIPDIGGTLKKQFLVAHQNRLP